MIVIDTGALLILLYGLVEPESISKKSRTKMYDNNDFIGILNFIKKDLSKLIILPNVWTEVSNLVHNRDYLNHQVYNYFKELASKSREIYIPSLEVMELDYYMNLGLTDSAIIKCAKIEKNTSIISADSNLINFAQAFGIHCYDVVLEMNQRRLK